MYIIPSTDDYTDQEHKDTYTILFIVNHPHRSNIRSMIIPHTYVLYYGEYVSCSSRPSPTLVGRVEIEAKSIISHFPALSPHPPPLFNFLDGGPP